LFNIYYTVDLLNAIMDHVYIIIPLEDQTCSVCSLMMGSECGWGIGDGSTFQYFDT